MGALGFPCLTVKFPPSPPPNFFFTLIEHFYKKMKHQRCEPSVLSYYNIISFQKNKQFVSYFNEASK